MPSPSPDIYGALVAFLDGDTGDVRSRVNALESGILVAGSVTVSRPSRGKTAQRGRSAPWLAIDIIPDDNAGVTRGAGIGVQEVDFGVRFEITARLKDTPPGKRQLRVLETIQNDLVRLYEGLSDLTITDPSGIASFVGSSARRGPADRTPENSEIQTATVLSVFTFLQPMTANA